MVKQFKMKIIHHYDNGDVLAVMSRKSLSEEDGNELSPCIRLVK